MTPTLAYKTPDYFTEVGAIHEYAKRLEGKGIDVVFTVGGIRLTEIRSDKVRTETYQTAAELRAYWHGLQDGFASPDKSLFTDEEWARGGKSS